MRLFFALVTLLVLVVTAKPRAKLSREEIIQRCRYASKEEMGDCLVKLIKEIQPQLEEGLPEFNIPPTDKIAVGDFTYSHYDNENSYIRSRIYKLTTKGVRDMQITKLNVDYDKHTVDIEAEAPEFFITGRYDMDAVVLMVPLKGDGTFWCRMENIRGKGKSEFTVDKDIDGKYRLLPVKSDFDFIYDKLYGKLNGLFPNDEVLQETVNVMLNENSDLLFEEAKPHIKMTLIDLAHDVAINVSRSVDLKEFAGYEFLREEFKFPEE